MSGLVGVLSVVGMVVVAPLGLRLLGTPGLRPLVRAWPFLGLSAGLGLLLRRGDLAVAAVVPYALACCAVAALAVRRALRWLRGERREVTREVVAAFAGVSLAVAASSLVAERAGVELLGLPLVILQLTVAHFHYAAFAAVLLAGLTARAAPGPVAAAGAWAVPGGTAVAYAGYFTGDAVGLAGAALLTAGLLLTSAALLRVRPHPLLVVAALAVPLTTAGLGTWWAAGEAFGFAHPTRWQMWATRGIGNALAIGLCGLVGWHRVAPPPL